MSSKINQPLKIIQMYPQYQIDFYNAHIHSIRHRNITDENYRYIDNFNCIYNDRRFHIRNHKYCLRANFSNKHITKYLTSKKLGQKTYPKACHQCTIASFYDISKVKRFNSPCRTAKFQRKIKNLKAQIYNLQKEFDLKNLRLLPDGIVLKTEFNNRRYFEDN